MDETTILSLLGKRVKNLRISRNLSQEELATLSDLDRTYISSIERGKRNVSLINLARLSDSLGISLSDLVDF